MKEGEWGSAELLWPGWCFHKAETTGETVEVFILDTISHQRGCSCKLGLLLRFDSSITVKKLCLIWINRLKGKRMKWQARISTLFLVTRRLTLPDRVGSEPCFQAFCCSPVTHEQFDPGGHLLILTARCAALLHNARFRQSPALQTLQ